MQKKETEQRAEENELYQEIYNDPIIQEFLNTLALGEGELEDRPELVREVIQRCCCELAEKFPKMLDKAIEENTPGKRS